MKINKIIKIQTSEQEMIEFALNLQYSKFKGAIECLAFCALFCGWKLWKLNYYLDMLK